MSKSLNLRSLASKWMGISSPESRYCLQASHTSKLAGTSLAFLFLGFPRSLTCQTKTRKKPTLLVCGQLVTRYLRTV